MKLKSLALVGLLTLASLASEAQTVLPSTNSATLAWNASSNAAQAAQPVTYQIGSGTNSGQYTSTNSAGTNTQLTVGSLPFGTVYFAVQGVDGNGVASPWSAEVSTSFLPPPVVLLAPTGLTIVATNGGTSGTGGGTNGTSVSH